MSFTVPLHAIMREIPRSLEQPRRLKHLEGIDFSDKSHILMCGKWPCFAGTISEEPHRAAVRLADSLALRRFVGIALDE